MKRLKNAVFGKFLPVWSAKAGKFSQSRFCADLSRETLPLCSEGKCIEGELNRESSDSPYSDSACAFGHRPDASMKT
jgi:hypothetical protein